jgi:hypothetical protein
LIEIDWPTVRVASTGLSHAELTLAAERAAKDAILQKKLGIATSGLVQALRERQIESQS